MEAENENGIIINKCVRFKEEEIRKRRGGATLPQGVESKFVRRSSIADAEKEREREGEHHPPSSSHSLPLRHGNEKK